MGGAATQPAAPWTHWDDPSVNPGAATAPSTQEQPNSSAPAAWTPWDDPAIASFAPDKAAVAVAPVAASASSVAADDDGPVSGPPPPKGFANSGLGLTFAAAAKKAAAAAAAAPPPTAVLADDVDPLDAFMANEVSWIKVSIQL